MNTHVTTLEQSKKLKEWGAPQDAGKWWFPHREMETHKLIEWKLLDNRGGSDESVAAYTLSEIIEWLGDDFWELQRTANGYGAYPAPHHGFMVATQPTLLEAVYALAEAIHNQQKEG